LYFLYKQRGKSITTAAFITAETCSTINSEIYKNCSCDFRSSLFV